jgi:hypothetical protein
VRLVATRKGSTEASRSSTAAGLAGDGMKSDKPTEKPDHSPDWRDVDREPVDLSDELFKEQHQMLRRAQQRRVRDRRLLELVSRGQVTFNEGDRQAFIDRLDEAEHNADFMRLCVSFDRVDELLIAAENLADVSFVEK